MRRKLSDKTYNVTSMYESIDGLLMLCKMRWQLAKYDNQIEENHKLSYYEMSDNRVSLSSKAWKKEESISLLNFDKIRKLVEGERTCSRTIGTWVINCYGIYLQDSILKLSDMINETDSIISLDSYS